MVRTNDFAHGRDWTLFARPGSPPPRSKTIIVGEGETFIVESAGRYGITFRRLIDGYYANLGNGLEYFEEVT